METPKIPTTNSPTTMNLTSSSDNSIKNRIEIGTENSPYVKGGYIFEFDKAKGGAYKYTYFTYGISQYPSDIKNFGAEYICNLDTLENIKLAAGEEVKIQDLGIRLYYKTGDQGLFMGKVVVGDKTISYRAADAITAFNPDFDGKNDASIAITDSYGILLGNLVLENLINDLVFCTDSIGNVTVFDDNNISNCGKVGLTVRSVDKLIGLPDNSILTIKKDVYITAQSFVKNNDVTVILDGGNLYRHHKVYALPNKIICKNGAVIDVPSDCQKLHPNNISGASQTHVMDANENCFFGLFGSQNNVAVEFNPMDFVKSEDCKAANSAASINLNNVLERIFTTIYNGNNQMQRMLIKMPETHYGSTNFYMDRPLHIPHNVTIDMSGAFIFVADSFQTDASGCIFSFDTNNVNVISATSIIKNFTMRFGTQILSNKKKPDNLRCIFDLTNFQGTLEDIKIYLNFNTEIIAFWQPFGTPFETYSDRKIIRRCSIGECGWRNETPVAIFCEGDGNIIEQCILGYVAIICGHSYTIKGCLNDKYFLYDTTADFNGSYWEVSQFEILDSKVVFSNCKLCAGNNNFRVNHETNLRYYLGPWMSVDTEGSRKRLVNMFKKFNLNLDRFNQVDESHANKKRYQGRGVSHRSTVEFASSIRVNLEMWGGMHSMASPLFKVGEGAKIIGIENLETPEGFTIQNSIENINADFVEIPVSKACWVPLINGNFADVKSDTIVPENIHLVALTEPDPNLNPKRDCTDTELGCDWNGDVFSNFRARFVLDEQRKLYSREFSISDNIAPQPGSRVRVNIFSDMSEQRYSNLKIELLFNRTTGNTCSSYKMRQHFNRVLDADIVSFGEQQDNGEPNLVPTYNKNVIIGLFNIVKSYFNKEKLENQVWRVNDGLSVKPVEPVEITDNLPKPNINGKALNDYYGNSYEPLALLPREYVNVATRIQWIGENNVRAFMTSLPQYGTWIDGDEVVLLTGVYRYFDGNWYEYITFRSGTLKPVDPGEGGITIDPIKPTEPILP